MSFDLHQLRAFVAIESAGSLGRAAEVLNITQPALSRTVRRLEDQVGAPLFERHSKGMQLTDVGQRLLPHATVLLHEADKAREEIDALRGLAKGTVRVGAIGSIAGEYLPQAVGLLLRGFPQLQVQVTEGVWDRLAESLVKHEIDLALGVLVDDTEEIVSDPQCRWHDHAHIYAARGHPLREQAGLQLADLHSAVWASTPRGTAPHEQLERLFVRHGVAPPAISVETRSIVTIKSLVAHSGFIAWMPDPTMKAETTAGWVAPLAVPGAKDQRTLTTFRRRRGILPRPAERLLDILRSMSEAPALAGASRAQR